MPCSSPHTRPDRDRAADLGLLARAPAPRLAALLTDLPPHSLLRPAETGTVMLRGRQGATGAAFNLGEMTVTRCSVRLQDGAVGHGYVQGRDKAHARRAALVDALLQTDQGSQLRAQIIAPLAAEEAARRSAKAVRAAATKVEFFTLARGEDR